MALPTPDKFFVPKGVSASGGKLSGPPSKKPSFWVDKGFEIIILVIFFSFFGAAFLPFINSDLVFSFGNYWAVVQKYVRPIFIILDAIFAFIAIYSIFQYRKIKVKLSIFERVPKKVKSEKDPKIKFMWDEIMKKGGPNASLESLRLVLIEADAFVDTFLKREGYIGDHMADRLSRILPEEIKSLDKVWGAHRLRNDVVHTSGFYTSPEAVRVAIKAFDDFLKEMGAI